MRALIIEKRVQNLNRLTTCSSYIAGTGIQPVQVFGGHSCPWYSNRDAAAANPGRTPQMIMYSHSDPSQNPSIKSSPRKSRSRAGSHHANR